MSIEKLRDKYQQKADYYWECYQMDGQACARREGDLMPTDTERREVARMLRELPGDSTYPDLIGVIADHDGWYPASDAADRLADLIEPSCDRDALLALADTLGSTCETDCRGCRLEGAGCAECSSGVAHEAADRIREACGEAE